MNRYLFLSFLLLALPAYGMEQPYRADLRTPQQAVAKVEQELTHLTILLNTIEITQKDLEKNLDALHIALATQDAGEFYNSLQGAQRSLEDYSTYSTRLQQQVTMLDELIPAASAGNLIEKGSVEQLVKTLAQAKKDLKRIIEDIETQKYIVRTTRDENAPLIERYLLEVEPLEQEVYAPVKLYNTLLHQFGELLSNPNNTSVQEKLNVLLESKEGLEKSIQATLQKINAPSKLGAQTKKRLSDTLEGMLVHLQTIDLSSLFTEAQAPVQGDNAPATPPTIGNKEEVVSCQACLEDTETNKSQRLTCGHIYCLECLDRLVKISVKDKDPLGNLVCKIDRCNKPFTEDELKTIIKDKNTLEKVKDLSAEQCIMRDPSVKHCPTANCKFMYFYADKQAKAVTCPQCNKTHCANCLKSHDTSLSCDHADKKLLEKWQKAHGARQCPSCDVVIEKNSGCNHMTCQNCTHQFCWVCRKPWGNCSQLYGQH
jgi:hypothetical protein